MYDGIFTENKVTEDGYEYTVEYQIVDGKFVEVEVKDWLKENLPEGQYPYYAVYRTLDNGGETAYWAYVSYDARLQGIAHFK